MPVNLKDNFKPRVAIKRSESCSWKRHFDGCARELIGILDLWAKNNQNRFVMASVPAITEACNGRYRKNKQPYSKRAVEQVLHALRELKIISPRIKMAVDGVEREGFVVAPHDSMAIRYPLACVIGGVGKGPGTWVNDIWVLDASSGEWFGSVVEGTTPETTPSTTPEDAHTTVQTTLRNVVQTTDRNVVRNVVLASQKSADESAYGSGAESGDIADISGITLTKAEVSPTNKPVIGVPNLLTSGTSLTTQPHKPDPERVCSVLFQEAAVEYQWTPTPKDHRDIAALVKEHGNEKVLSAGRLFIKDPPAIITTKTKCPWMFFVSGFEGYVARVADEVKHASQKMTPAEMEAIEAAALEAHRKQWGLQEPDAKPGPEAFLDLLADEKP